MKTPHEMIGRVVGRLTVQSFSHWAGGRDVWVCRCECGSVKAVMGLNLRKSAAPTRSCGCLRSDVTRNSSLRHGMYGTPTYTAWRGMMDRCLNPMNTKHANYGGRGITICERWRLFENFFSDMGARPPGLTIERSDNEGPYAPGNCEWATRARQSRNTRRSIRITIAGETRVLKDWLPAYGITYHGYRRRRQAGMTVEEALTTPKTVRRSAPA